MGHDQPYSDIHVHAHTPALVYDLTLTRSRSLSLGPSLHLSLQAKIIRTKRARNELLHVVRVQWVQREGVAYGGPEQMHTGQSVVAATATTAAALAS
jgi:hypothetical protein